MAGKTLKEYEDFEKQTKLWVSDMSNPISPESTKKRVLFEIALSQYMLLWNMNDNLSLIRDLLFDISKNPKK